MPEQILDAARDFRIGSEMLALRFGQTVFPLRSTIVTGAFSIELYIKFLMAVNNVAVAKKHDLAKLYVNLPSAVQQRVAVAYEGNGSVEQALGQFKGVFVDWRYVFEKQDTALSLNWRDFRLLGNAFELAAAAQDPRKSAAASAAV